MASSCSPLRSGALAEAINAFYVNCAQLATRLAPHGGRVKVSIELDGVEIELDEGVRVPPGDTLMVLRHPSMIKTIEDAVRFSKVQGSFSDTRDFQTNMGGMTVAMIKAVTSGINGGSVPVLNTCGYSAALPEGADGFAPRQGVWPRQRAGDPPARRKSAAASSTETSAWTSLDQASKSSQFKVCDGKLVKERARPPKRRRTEGFVEPQTFGQRVEDPLWICDLGQQYSVHSVDSMERPAPPPLPPPSPFGLEAQQRYFLPPLPDHSLFDPGFAGFGLHDLVGFQTLQNNPEPPAAPVAVTSEALAEAAKIDAIAGLNDLCIQPAPPAGPVGCTAVRGGPADFMGRR